MLAYAAVKQTIIQIFEVVKLSDLVFFAFATLSVIGALGCALSRNIVYSAFSLLATLFGVAALFAWLSADYLAITQLIVYVGGVLVLFLFAVMLTNKITDSEDVDTDPTTLSLLVRSPSRTVTTYTEPDDITKDDIGDYHYDLELTEAGTWHYRWVGTGVAAGAAEGQLRCRRQTVVE